MVIGQDGGRGHGDDAHPVGAGDAGELHHGGADEGADEDADPVDAAERGQRPRPDDHRHRLGQVFLPGQAEDARGHADNDHGRGEQPESAGQQRGQRRGGQGDGARGRRADHGPAFAELQRDE